MTAVPARWTFDRLFFPLTTLLVASRAVQALGAGEVQIGFVNRNHFDDRRESLENVVDLSGVLAVLRVVPAQENRVRAELFRGANRHRGVDAVFARRVACRRHHASAIRVRAHNHRFSHERRIFQLFDRDKESVHVHMKN